MIGVDPYNYDNTIPDFIIRTIENSPNQWGWLIRLHPQYRSKKTHTDLVDSFSEKDLFHQKVKFVTDMPLVKLLQNCDHLVLGWSGLAFDALTFNVPTTFTHSSAYQYSPIGIKESYFGFASNSEQLFSNIEASKKGQVPKNDATPINDPKLIEETFDLLLNNGLSN